MAIGRLDGSILIWNTTTLPAQWVIERFCWALSYSAPWSFRPTLLTHRDSKLMVRNIAFTHDGQTFVACNESGQIYIWTSVPSWEGIGALFIRSSEKIVVTSVFLIGFVVKIKWGAKKKKKKEKDALVRRYDTRVRKEKNAFRRQHVTRSTAPMVHTADHAG